MQADFNLTTLFISPSHCQSNLHDEYRIINSKINFVWCKNRIAFSSSLRWCDSIWHGARLQTTRAHASARWQLAFSRHKIKMNSNNYNLHVNYTWALKMSSIFSHCFVNGKKISLGLISCRHIRCFDRSAKHSPKASNKNPKFLIECGEIDQHNEYRMSKASKIICIVRIENIKL